MTTFGVAVLFVNGAGAAPPPFTRGPHHQVAMLTCAEAWFMAKHITADTTAENRILVGDFMRSGLVEVLPLNRNRVYHV
jgi:hypothetical protein